MREFVQKMIFNWKLLDSKSKRVNFEVFKFHILSCEKAKK